MLGLSAWCCLFRPVDVDVSITCDGHHSLYFYDRRDVTKNVALVMTKQKNACRMTLNTKVSAAERSKPSVREKQAPVRK